MIDTLIKNSQTGNAFAIVVCAFVFLAPISVWSETFEVTNELDGPAPGPEGSLRWAISEANMNAGEDTIRFAEAVEEIVLDAQINVTEAVSINGFRRFSETQPLIITTAETILARIFAFDSDDPNRLEGGLDLANVIIIRG